MGKLSCSSSSSLLTGLCLGAPHLDCAHLHSKTLLNGWYSCPYSSLLTPIPPPLPVQVRFWESTAGAPVIGSIVRPLFAVAAAATAAAKRTPRYEPMALPTSPGAPSPGEASPTILSKLLPHFTSSVASSLTALSPPRPCPPAPEGLAAALHPAADAVQAEGADWQLAPEGELC